MLRLIGFMLVSMVSALVLIGCSSANSADIQTSLNQQFTLPIGKTASVSGENLYLKFLAVTGDSRCPSGAQCIWAGEAACSVEIKYNGQTSDIVLTAPGLTPDNNQNILNHYELNFQLAPYPELGKQISNSEYKLLLRISKSP